VLAGKARTCCSESNSMMAANSTSGATATWRTPAAYRFAPSTPTARPQVHAVLRCEAGHDIATMRQVQPRPGPGATRLDPDRRHGRTSRKSTATSAAR